MLNEVLIDTLIVPYLSADVKKILSYTCQYFKKYRHTPFDEHRLVVRTIQTRNFAMLDWILSRYALPAHKTWRHTTHPLHRWHRRRVYKVVAQHYCATLVQRLTAAGFPLNAMFAGALVQFSPPECVAGRLATHGLRISKAIIKCAGKVQNTAYLPANHLTIHYIRGLLSAGHVAAAETLIRQRQVPSATVSQYALRYSVLPLQTTRRVHKFAHIKKAIAHNNVAGLARMLQYVYPTTVFSQHLHGDAILNNMYAECISTNNTAVFCFMLAHIMPTHFDTHRLLGLSSHDTATVAWSCRHTAINMSLIYDLVCMHFSLLQLISIMPEYPAAELLSRRRLDFMRYYAAAHTDIAAQLATIRSAQWTTDIVAFLYMHNLVDAHVLDILRYTNIGYVTVT